MKIRDQFVIAFVLLSGCAPATPPAAESPSQEATDAATAQAPEVPPPLTPNAKFECPRTRATDFAEGLTLLRRDETHPLYGNHPVSYYSGEGWSVFGSPVAHFEVLDGGHAEAVIAAPFSTVRDAIVARFGACGGSDRADICVIAVRERWFEGDELGRVDARGTSDGNQVRLVCHYG